MQFARLTVGDPTAAIGLELDIIAAVVIGGGEPRRRRGLDPRLVIGAFVMAFLSNGCTWPASRTTSQEIIIGAIIIAAVAVDRLRHRRQRSADRSSTLGGACSVREAGSAVEGRQATAGTVVARSSHAPPVQAGACAPRAHSGLRSKPYSFFTTFTVSIA